MCPVSAYIISFCWKLVTKIHLDTKILHLFFHHLAESITYDLPHIYKYIYNVTLDTIFVTLPVTVISVHKTSLIHYIRCTSTIDENLININAHYIGIEALKMKITIEELKNETYRVDVYKPGSMHHGETVCTSSFAVVDIVEQVVRYGL